MNEKLNITREDTSAEVLVRIIKAASHKYECSMVIKFRNGNRISKFIP
mgnify:CR=1 FL=1